MAKEKKIIPRLAGLKETRKRKRGAEGGAGRRRLQGTRPKGTEVPPFPVGPGDPRAAEPGAEDAAGPRGPEPSGSAVSALAGRPGKVSSQQRSGGNRSPAALEAPRSEELRGWDPGGREERAVLPSCSQGPRQLPPAARGVEEAAAQLVPCGQLIWCLILINS
ncbi:cuticle collagen 2-like [Cricetulus griseus]|uniref:Cuticle collagen 2-like n=1 Tax=Cricetulus griseus TaxID=10029 RepID=A0A9J7H897_CRIGR|nr:cuticle collagen 2-like [Cricetulus griseus]